MHLRLVTVLLLLKKLRTAWHFQFRIEHELTFVSKSFDSRGVLKKSNYSFIRFFMVLNDEYNCRLARRSSLMNSFDEFALYIYSCNIDWSYFANRLTRQINIKTTYPHYLIYQLISYSSYSRNFIFKKKIVRIPIYI